MTFYAEETPHSGPVKRTSTNPCVTGVSPKEGPPGTRIIIRGENLGVDAKDLIGLQICGVDCLLSAEWKTPSKIIARTGPGKGKGDLVVTTRTGGIGTCTVEFRGYFIQISPLQDSAVWFDETQSVPPIPGRGVPTTPIVDREEENPLGISDEGHQAKYTEEELLEIFPEASGNMSLENFSPAWYLLESHHSTAFDDLKAGLAHMKRKASRRSEGPIAFMKSNLSSTLDCQKSLAEMYEKFTENDIRGTSLNSYAVLLMQAKACADGLFKDVLGRKDRADSTRNALSVLNRFKFLFYLPLNIERNVQKGDYNLVINDYIRAKSLFADTQVDVFKKVYMEVESRIKRFTHLLQAKLLQLPNTIEEQKNILRYLSNLECEGDAAWACIINQQRWLVGMLVDCRQDHLDAEKRSQAATSDKPAQVKAPITLHRRSGPRRNPSFTSTLTTNQPGLKIDPPERVLFVEELSSIMLENFPDLWKLGNAYLSGTLVKEATEKPFKLDTVKQTEFKSMMLELTQLYTNLVRGALLSQSLASMPVTERQMYDVWSLIDRDDGQVMWLPASVRFVRNCFTSLAKLDLPAETFELLSQLTFDLRAHCLVALLKRSIQDVRLLHSQETWSIDTDDEFGGITQLPALFENVITETIQHLHEVVVQVRIGEPEIFSQQSVRDETSELCTLLLQAFTESLRILGLQHSHSSHKDEAHDDKLPPLDHRLMMCLSNCNHTIQRVLPRLVDNLSKHGYVQSQETLETVLELYYELDSELFDAYIEEKCNPIIGVIEQNIYRGGFDWLTCSIPKCVRSYMKNIIMGMVDVHAEVYRLSPSCMLRVMCQIVEGVTEELSRVIQCVSSFSNNGAMQARLELLALQEAISLYQTDEIRSSFKEALSHLPDLTTSDKKEVDELLNKFRSQNKFMFMCYYPDSIAIKSPTTPASTPR